MLVILITGHYCCQISCAILLRTNLSNINFANSKGALFGSFEPLYRIPNYTAQVCNQYVLTTLMLKEEQVFSNLQVSNRSALSLILAFAKQRLNWQCFLIQNLVKLPIWDDN